jgi:hypothetical protein
VVAGVVVGVTPRSVSHPLTIVGQVDYVQLFSQGSRYNMAGALDEFLGKTAQATAQRLQNWGATTCSIRPSTTSSNS